jgi:hypothetical protein
VKELLWPSEQAVTAQTERQELLIIYGRGAENAYKLKKYEMPAKKQHNRIILRDYQMTLCTHS